jgi:glutamate racemase
MASVPDNPTAATLPIGVFDSGLGGLTIVKALKELLPHEPIIYYGDTAHLPYGDKSPEVLRGYIAGITEFLLAQPVKAIVVACNTASSVGIDVVQALAGSLPVFEVIKPVARVAAEATQNGLIGVIGTKTTITSHIYLRTLLALRPDAHVVEKATPLLVPMIEEGWSNNRIAQEVIEAYMSDTGFAHIDTLILGCTHYPLVQQNIQTYFDQHVRQHVTVLNSSDATSAEVAAYLGAHGLLRPAYAPAQPDNFYVSDVGESFRQSVAVFFARPIQLLARTL